MSEFQSRRLRLVEFNVENLFVLMDHYQGQDLTRLSETEWQRLSASTTPNKPLSQVFVLARAIQEMNPDILMLCEVGGRESLLNFSRHFLKGAYTPHLLEGNSDRGIDMGYLVKADLPFTYDLFSHKNRPLDFLYPHEKQTQETGYDHLPSAKITSHRFSRDVLELRVFADATEPCLILLLVHLKSQLDRNRIDPGGRDRRRAEVEKLVHIYLEIESEFSARVPVMLAGDFNGSATKELTDLEFAAIYRETKLTDALEIAGIPLESRFTHMQLSNHRPGRNRQLDYIFVPPLLRARVNRAETAIFHFTDDMGMVLPIPRSLNEKRLLPSDHYPVVLTLNPE